MASSTPSALANSSAVTSTEALVSTPLDHSADAVAGTAVQASGVFAPALSKVVRDSQALLSGSAAQWTASDEQLPGGTRLVLPGTIVPDSPGPGQITEFTFVQLLAAEVARRLPNAPGAGDANTAQVEILEGGIAAIFTALTGSGAPLESVLRMALGLPSQLSDPIGVDVLIDRTIELLPPASDLQTMLQLGLAFEELGSPGSASVSFPVKDLLAGAGILYWPREPAHPGDKLEPTLVSKKRWSQLVGNDAHAIIQAHYWLKHPNDVMLFEDFIVVGAQFLTKVWDAGDWGSLGAVFPAIASALKTDAGGLKRPDILNVSQQVLYEIKPLGDATGPVQLADYMSRLAPGLPALRLGLASDWSPYPVYYVGGTTVIVAELAAPGLIVYFRVMTPLPRITTLRAWRDQQRNKTTMASVAAPAVLALIIVAAVLGAAIGGPAGAPVATEGAISLAALIRAAMVLGMQPLPELLPLPGG